ncbi:MAG: hypothetical protein JWO31_4292 [Phycisphaerales bacterium]|nr:hypothetical protein [Phycisphaerales bacterium]
MQTFPLSVGPSLTPEAMKAISWVIGAGTVGSVCAFGVIAYVGGKMACQPPSHSKLFFPLLFHVAVPLLTVGMVISTVTVLGLAGALTGGEVVGLVSSIVGFTIGVGASKLTGGARLPSETEKGSGD